LISKRDVELSEAVGVRLREALLRKAPMSSLARSIGEKVLETIGELEGRCAAVTIDLRNKKAEVIRIAPERVGASEIQIWVYRHPVNEDQLVGVSAGAGIYFNAPETPDYCKHDVIRIVCSFVAGTVDGHLKETIYETGSAAYRWVFELPTQLGMIRLDRTNVQNQFRGLFKKKARRTVVYAPYVE